MGISMSLLIRKMYTKWHFLVGMVYLSTLLCHLGLCPKYVLEGNKSSSF